MTIAMVMMMIKVNILNVLGINVRNTSHCASYFSLNLSSQ